MPKVTIYHNPRCSKSRQTLQLLKDNNIEPTIIEYLKTPPSRDELKKIAKALKLPPQDFIRTKETIYKQLNLATQTDNPDTLFNAIAEHPILLERPIVIVGNKARLARPPENILDILP